MYNGHCVYPGSFDPVTRGHMDIIERAAKQFETVTVAILHNPAKEGCFPLAKRLSMLERACAHLPNVTLDSFDGLLMDYMRGQKATIVLRGLRAVTDFESEFQMAQLNRQLKPEVETLFLMTSPDYGYLSSSAVREIGSFGGDISGLVPACVLQDVRLALKSENHKEG